MKLIINILIFLFTLYTFSQSSINGIVKDSTLRPISYVNVVLKDSLDNIITYAITNDKGKYQTSTFNYVGNAFLHLSHISYKKKTESVLLINSKSTLTMDFTMKEADITNLDEIVIKGNLRPYSKKKDTISYNVSKYINGSERKIEEVIKKLPGIELNEQSGEITYKGKSIETVTLDGDNLFGFNYSLGTKNINIDLVEQIEAIDNYAENPLLKDIEQGGKVSLNLKLKKGKVDVSGNLDFGSGWFNDGDQAFNIASNILGITKTYKSFATLTYNNTGINKSPFDYFGYSFNAEQLKERNYFAEKNISETRISNILENNRININNQFFGNYSAIFKLNPKLSIKTNLYYLQDRINTNQIFQNDFIINNDSFSTTDNTFITKKPIQYRGDVEIKYNTSNTSLLEYNLRLRQEDIVTPTTVIQNQTSEFSTFLNTEDFYLKQDLVWTKKLSNKKALQVSLFHSFNDLPQTFSIKPSLFDEDASSDNQESRFEKTYLEAKATYLSSGKRDKYTFTFGGNFNYSPFISRLFNIEETTSVNNFDYTQSNIFNTGVYNFNRGKWQISPSYSLRLLNQRLNQNIEPVEQLQNDFIIEPAFLIKYNLNTSSFLMTNIGFNQNTNSEQYFFLNQVLIDNRTTIKNTPSLELQNSQRYSLLYFNNDLYNQLQLNASINYQISNGNFFTNQNINENTTQLEYFFLPQDNSNWNINTQISKYIPFLNSTVKLTSNYSISNFRNIVNNSNLRQNQSQFLSNSFFYKTAFKFPINFENTFIYQYSYSKSENQSAFINKSWQNKFKVIIKPNKKWFVVLSSDYYLPNTKLSDEQFFFLDATLRHRPKSKKWGTSLTLSNITNEINFEQIRTSDISTTIFRSNLLPRYILLNLTWNF
ncbi:MAG: hypothetical protein COY55_13135 [Flavobacteriaceae bacterium CG_4_10_14_0_8_um_filter_31_99]|nr:carboxypeptidase regulatory-like domain-containing protein [Flavobacteriia bacterium]PIV97730.1 MAG: hypothetical protein COW43_01585 [Flavobacteriaceae bacterium CG17_big_fil_post_rev_8_21_14_2_50_31_13]PIZ09385.1 MAG: hypothetical protein COY55_13135 [Flavobacteriaceae bacterium CG_4_10_14_0_8_um_filter_31_99]